MTRRRLRAAASRPVRSVLAGPANRPRRPSRCVRRARQSLLAHTRATTMRLHSADGAGNGGGGGGGTVAVEKMVWQTCQGSTAIQPAAPDQQSRQENVRHSSCLIRQTHVMYCRIHHRDTMSFIERACEALTAQVIATFQGTQLNLCGKCIVDGLRSEREGRPRHLDRTCDNVIVCLEKQWHLARHRSPGIPAGRVRPFFSVELVAFRRLLLCSSSRLCRHL